MNLLRALAAVVRPPRCACELATPLNSQPGHGLCESCHSVLTRAETRDETYAPFEYGGPLASVVVAAKFGRRETSAMSLGRLLAEDTEARARVGAADALVPIPLAPLRHFERGFNPAQLIARECSRSWSIPVRHLLKRTRETRPQSDLSLVERSTNVLGAFAVVAPVPPRVGLLDDVVTSGATLAAAAEALRRAGARDVVRIAVCRSE